MVGRRAAKLNAVAEEVRRQFGVEAEVTVADLSNPDELARLEQVVSERGPFSFLINNAGFGTSGRFADVDRAKHITMVRVHVEATVRLTHAVLPAMKAALEADKTPLYFPKDGHCTAAGYRVVAQTIFTELVTRKIVD